jgi:hypothetical protein
MAMTCASCGYYTAESEESCRKCNIPLKMTFLPPATAVADPVILPAPLAPGTPSYPMPGFRGSYDVIEIILRNRFVAGLIAVPLVFFGFWMAGLTSESGPRGKYNAIRLGMSVEQVHEILYADSKFSHSTRVSANGDAQMSYSEGPIKITVYFRNGKVVNKQMTGSDEIDDAIATGLDTRFRQ